MYLTWIKDNWILLVYIVGFLATYVYCKIQRGKDPRSNQWKDVLITTGFSLLSWVFFIILLLSYVIDWDIFKKPPKWL